MYIYVSNSQSYIQSLTFHASAFPKFFFIIGNFLQTMFLNIFSRALTPKFCTNLSLVWPGLRGTFVSFLGDPSLEVKVMSWCTLVC